MLTKIPNEKFERIQALDALRGFDMFWITGADAIGGAMAQLDHGPITHQIAVQLDHAEWAGFHAYDLIFPLFVFMAGVAIPLSLGKYQTPEQRHLPLPRILRRTLVLVLLGLFYNGGLSESFEHLRLLGVLQRIGICYGISSILFLHVNSKALIATLLGLLGGYWLLLTFVPVPGFGAGDFSEGHNLTNWIDAHYLPLRKWDGDHDPEGLLSTLPAIASCLGGVLTGIYLKSTSRRGASLAVTFLVSGLALLTLGYLWGIQFPLIKKIWTSTFVLVAGGWSLVLLSAFYYMIDVLGFRRWALPFVWIGANPLTLYIISNVVGFDALSSRLVGGPVARSLNGLSAGLGSLTGVLVSSLLCILLARWLYNHRLFIRI